MRRAEVALFWLGGSEIGLSCLKAGGGQGQSSAVADKEGLDSAFGVYLADICCCGRKRHENLCSDTQGWGSFVGDRVS